MPANRRNFTMKVAGSLLAVLCLLHIGYADDDHDVAKRLKESGNILPLAKILEAMSIESSGHVLEIELRNHDGRLVYHVELVDAYGVVWYLQFDARRGTLLYTYKEKAQ